jgi:hypothetical protein
VTDEPRRIYKDMEMNNIGHHEKGKVLSNEELWTALERFIEWLKKADGASYDPYDLPSTRYGRWARRLYYEKHPAGVVVTAPLILIELLAPSLRSLFVQKGRFATADAQLALAFMNLHQVMSCGMNSSATSETDAASFLQWAKTLTAALLSQSIPGYSGDCWGYPFDWQNVNGLMPKNTPHITATPYCYEAFARMYDVTEDESYFDTARSIAAFVCNDLNDTPTSEGAAAASYTPYDCSKVVNASAYRALVMFNAGWRFENELYLEKAWKNLKFILEAQRDDGSWLYAIDNPREAFIDHFHTCFVLKNLQKINRTLQNADVQQAIAAGYEYYRKNLFDEDCNPKSYTIVPRVQIVRLEMYNMAEAITLGALLRDDIPEAYQLAHILASRLANEYQLAEGHWITRVYLGGIRHTFPFLRWPQSQLFHALTNLLVARCNAPLPISQQFASHV